MRIRDWSSDVCSSDLRNRRANEDQRRAGRPAERGCRFKGHGGPPPSAGWPARADRPDSNSIIVVALVAGAGHHFLGHLVGAAADRGFEPLHQFGILGQEGLGILARSEEHTSELQSLMRISYAVFCLKQKKKISMTRQPVSTH